MNEEHPNLQVLSKLNMLDLDASANLFAADFVWHYFNPNLPDIQGNYEGVDGLKHFFQKLGAKTRGTFKISVQSVKPMGDELVVIHVRNSMQLDDKEIRVDAVVVWRVVYGLLKEAWDIPSAYTLAA